MKKINLRRVSKYRDVKKFICIASEGTKTEPNYFKGLKISLKNPNIHIKSIARDDTASAPNHVLRKVNEFKKETRLMSTDELWLVIDIDRWTTKMLSEIARECLQHKYFLAVSNPRFELWLLLHLADVSKYKNEEKDKLKKVNGHIENRIKEICGSYKKNCLNMEIFRPKILKAIKRAKKLDKNIRNRWPNVLGTHVYKLAESIYQLDI